MNERVWQLQGQAKVLGEQHIAHRKFDDVMEYKQVLYDTTMNKFAELIVLECIKQGDALVKHYINTHTEQDQALLLACIADYTNQIKKHFGVE